ncbi:kinase-like domain-containing protein, partial [Lactifluus subvellereus]
MIIEELQTNPDDVSCHVGWTAGAYKTCGQLIAYATALHRSQFRVFSFSIALFGDTGRFLRWDRSGVIYTKPFKWAKGDLLEFLWRFNHLSAVDRGYDTTVSSVEDGEAELALPKLKTYPKFENLQKGHLHKILVWDDRAPDENPKCYITPSAKWATEALIGRATFGYIAYDVESGNLVYLKDYWRVDHPDVQKEGDVYRELHEAEVPNIARMGRAGDVPRISGRGGLEVSWPAVQRTKTQDYLSGPGSPHSWCPGHPRVETYIHYRLVLETVGMSLNRFRSTRQLCEVIRDAIVAHTAAYNKTRILHRDISAGNILITDKGTGILIDWDLSKKVKEVGDSKPRRHSRTGTWQFISIARLLDPWSRPHEVSDDLESFFWVLLYEVVRY